MGRYEHAYDAYLELLNTIKEITQQLGADAPTIRYPKGSIDEQIESAEFYISEFGKKDPVRNALSGFYGSEGAIAIGGHDVRVSYRDGATKETSLLCLTLNIGKISDRKEFYQTLGERMTHPLLIGEDYQQRDRKELKFRIKE
jgi:hypothetical protein